MENDLLDLQLAPAAKPKSGAIAPSTAGGDMDLDQNEDHRNGGVKRSAAPAPASPARQRAEARAGGITLDDIRGLLGEQTRMLQESNQQDLMDLKTATFKELGTIKKDMRRQSDHIDQLRDAQDRMEERILALEEKGAGGPQASSTAASEPGRPNLLIISGWPQDTRRETLLKELGECLSQLGLENAFEEYFCTGPRRGFAMAFLVTDAHESGAQLRRRLITTAQQIQKANLHTATMDPGKIMKATLGKSREERLISNHAGKTKRLVLTAAPNLQPKLETEFAAGNVWLQDKLIASANRTPPHTDCVKGKPARSWIDLRYLATILRVPEDRLTEQWNDLMAL